MGLISYVNSDRFWRFSQVAPIVGSLIRLSNHVYPHSKSIAFIVISCCFFCNYLIATNDELKGQLKNIAKLPLDVRGLSST